MKIKSTEITVNGATWNTNQRRRDIACTVCEVSTKGRLNGKPYCLDCGMKELLKPLSEVKDFLWGLFA